MNTEDLSKREEIGTFEEASRATGEMFDAFEVGEDFVANNDEKAPDALPEDNKEVVSKDISAVTEEAVNTAEIAAQAAADKDRELQEAMRLIEQLSNENKEIKATIEQMNNVQKENLIDEVMEMPMLDISTLAFDDENTLKQKQSKYAEQMAQFTEKKIMDRLSPFLKEAEAAQFEKQKGEVLSALSSLPELGDITEVLPQLDKIISNNKALSQSDIPLEEKYITAYAIAKGVNAMQKPKEENTLSPQQLMELYEQNKEFQDLIEQKRLEKVKQNKDVPVFSASNGAANAALNIKDKPQTFEEASERTRQMFGV